MIAAKTIEAVGDAPAYWGRFVARREESLPEWANEPRFDHLFRLMVNTAVAESSWGRPLETGDEITIREPIEAPIARRSKR